jgi:hypothetical protein
MELVFVWIAIAIVTGLAATGKGRSFWGWLLIGVFTGIFGLIAVLVMKPVVDAVPDRSGSGRLPSSRITDDWPKRSKPPAAPVDLVRVVGDGQFAFDIVGEGSYQESLEHFAGGKKTIGANVTVQVMVVPEDGNPHDANAVRVICQGVTVGYLSRRDAIAWRAALSEQQQKVQNVTARAVIVGGWANDEDEGEFGMRLDVAKPLRFRG